jgi:protein disulfide-isomerase A6
MTTDEEAGKPYLIKGFPSIKFFGFDKSKPTDYTGGRDEQSLVGYAIDKVGSEVKKR